MNLKIFEFSNRAPLQLSTAEWFVNGMKRLFWKLIVLMAIDLLRKAHFLFATIISYGKLRIEFNIVPCDIPLLARYYEKFE